jgi:hypothetical protein
MNMAANQIQGAAFERLFCYSSGSFANRGGIEILLAGEPKASHAKRACHSIL